MKKRWISFVLVCALVAALTGCGSKKTADSGENAVKEEQTDAATGGAQSADEKSEEVNAAKEEEQEPAVDASPEQAEDAGAETEGQEKQTEGENDMSNEVQHGVPILKEAVTRDMGCRIGAAATEAELNDPKVWEIITTHFNALTFGNELKPDALVDYSVDNCPGTEEAELNGETIVVPKLSYARAERMLNKVYDWNQDNPDQKIMVRGHVLVWHSQTPEWFFHEDYDKKKDYVNKETMNKRLEWYIRTVLDHFVGEDSKYKDCFYGWDVVNEACADNPTYTYRTDAENPNEALSESRHGSNSSWWHIYESNEFIINAFIYANKYAPEWLELYYNDYNECDTFKMNHIMELLQVLKEKEGAPGEGTRISAMGMQGHYSMASPGFDKVEYAIKKYAEIVGKVQITEFDMKARDGYDGSDEMKEEEYQKEYARYKLLYKVMKNLNAQDDIEITGITFWGTTDNYSWLQSRSNVGGGSTKNLPQCPLLFDGNYQVKPCFYAFIEE